ncbi:MAG: transcription termination/antitermination protein NusA, partial [Clostridia bacterium]|nr:transcription termination/antitermination protein NusA [Clostridia bacterium]
EEISLEEAQRLDPRYRPGDRVEVEVTPRNFGRIAAQTAKQVVVQRIREAERNLVYDEFSGREQDIVTGVVRRTENRNVLIDLGRTEAILAPSEQVSTEVYRQGERIKTYILEVRKTTKGPQILVSRTHPGLVRRLFELEVPEIHDGIVEIKAVAREPGLRSKIAVHSHDHNVDPIGACVGPRGMRVQTVVNELRGEKIDIIRWSPDTAEFVGSALSPAKVIAVELDEENRTAQVIVPDYQLSLAIGREGQNARLAARLTGWKIDIKSESQAAG